MDFSEEVEVHFENKDYERLLGLIFNPDNQVVVQQHGMDLITRICELGIAYCDELDALRACQDMLMHVTSVIRPKEALISLLEQAEIFVPYESNKFASLLAPLQRVMMNLPKKREHSFSWVLSILNSHMKARHKLSTKIKSKFVQGRESFLIEVDPEVKELLQSYKEYCNFYTPFVQQFWIERTAAFASNDANAISSIHRQEEILRDHLVQLLGDPMLHMDLHWEDKQNSEPPAPHPQGVLVGEEPGVIKTDARLISERLMEFLRYVDQNPEYYLEWCVKKIFLEESNLKNKPIYCPEDGNESDDADSDECIVEFRSVINYFYLIYVEGMNRDRIPCVLSPSHVFISATRLMLGTLAQDKQCPIALNKCMHLSQVLLNDIDERLEGIRLEAELLETDNMLDYTELIAYYSVYSETLEVRKQGLKVLKLLLWKFEPKGRYDFIRFVYQKVENDGIKGYIITQLKDCIHEALGRKSPGMMTYFTGKSLLKLLTLTCRLASGETTDLMQNSEQIISSLNLVLYLAIRDKSENITGFSEALPQIEAKLLEPLYKALDLSRAHYLLRLKELQEDPTKVIEDHTKIQKQISEKMEVTVGNVNPKLPRYLTVEEQQQNICSCLTTFDIMNGTLGRVNELCNAFKNVIKIPDNRL